MGITRNLGTCPDRAAQVLRRTHPASVWECSLSTLSCFPSSWLWGFALSWCSVSYRLRVMDPIDHGWKSLELWVQKNGLLPKLPQGFHDTFEKQTNIVVSPQHKIAVLTARPPSASVTLSLYGNMLKSVSVLPKIWKSIGIDLKHICHITDVKWYTFASCFLKTRPNGEQICLFRVDSKLIDCWVLGRES